ncbi:sporulation protein YabP [Caloramator sp. E03]|uniref:sporulation protein YabP n=1 Tax=Caloramator sp. E03 TaxID=2576307 RepID=UPI001110F75E|nr:sporulation protein YabP [Caloramator sp. E03]QCX33754.1 sporulation protein YabP [Caloramator sp. E03]
MENKAIKSQQNHIVHIENRQKVDITGVINVATFNEENIVLFTQMGGLNIKGKNLKVNKLNVDTGDMCIEGEFLSMTYTAKEVGNKESIFKKLFK